MCAAQCIFRSFLLVCVVGSIIFEGIAQETPQPDFSPVERRREDTNQNTGTFPKNHFSGAHAKPQGFYWGFDPLDWSVEMVELEATQYLLQDEYPVFIPAFRIARFAVTQQFYHIVMGGKRPVELYKPVVQVNWLAALQFANELSRLAGLKPAYRIRKLNDSSQSWPKSQQKDKNKARYEVLWLHEANGYRLPTEAEWEYAAQGGADGRRFLYSGSNSAEDVAWYASNSGRLRIVGQKEPNELGLYDMSGNTWEWLWDRFAPLNNSFGSKDSLLLGPKDLNNSHRAPVWRGPGLPQQVVYLGQPGKVRVCRGGGWNAPMADSQVLQRRACDETAHYYSAVGFRLAQDK